MGAKEDGVVGLDPTKSLNMQGLKEKCPYVHGQLISGDFSDLLKEEEADCETWKSFGTRIDYSLRLSISRKL